MAAELLKYLAYLRLFLNLLLIQSWSLLNWSCLLTVSNNGQLGRWGGILLLILNLSNLSNSTSSIFGLKLVVRCEVLLKLLSQGSLGTVPEDVVRIVTTSHLSGRLLNQLLSWMTQSAATHLSQLLVPFLHCVSSESCWISHELRHGAFFWGFDGYWGLHRVSLELELNFEHDIVNICSKKGF